MRRILLVVAYDGTDYHGWQVQVGDATIEGELNKAIESLTGQVTEVIGASRTDAGVHGLCNRAVFDTDSTIPAERFAPALNTYLPQDIRVIESREVDGEWHPRHCDTHKTYEYRIDCNEVANPLLTRYAWNVKGPLDIEAMRGAAKVLIGEHDFNAFSSVNKTVTTTVRTIYSIDIDVSDRDGELKTLNSYTGDIFIRVKGNGFLYNMVRIIVGTLVQVGMGRMTSENVTSALESLDRTKAGPTAPPQGLTLLKIEDVCVGFDIDFGFG